MKPIYSDGLIHPVLRKGKNGQNLIKKKTKEELLILSLVSYYKNASFIFKVLVLQKRKLHATNFSQVLRK